MNGLIALDQLYFPQEAIHWPEHWWVLNDDKDQDFRMRMQHLLNGELSEQHPLWGLQPVVLAKDDDDLVVHLNDGHYAVVHIVGSGKIDQYPTRFPSCYIFGNVTELQQWLEDPFGS